MPSVLVVGATGLLGAPLTRQIRREYADWNITVYVRNTTHDDFLKSNLGANSVVHGSFDEAEKISALVAEHDVVVNAGSSFDPKLSAAIIDGLSRRPAVFKGLLIHISGVGNFIDRRGNGEANTTGKVWNDADEDDIRKINSSMLNGAADKLILEASDAGAINAFIVCLGGTYGASSGPAPSLGVLYNILVSNSKACGYVPLVGEGSNIFWTIHVNDAVRFVMKVLTSAVAGPVNGSAYSRYYIAASQSNTWKDIASVLAPVLHSRGVVPSPEPRSVTIDKAGEGEVPLLLGSNVLVKGDRAAAWGFAPKERPFLEHIRADLSECPF